MKKIIALVALCLFLGAGCSSSGGGNTSQVPADKTIVVPNDSSDQNKPTITDIQVGIGLDREAFTIAKETKIFDAMADVAVVGRVKNIRPDSNVFVELSSASQDLIKMNDWFFRDENPKRAIVAPGEEKFYFNFSVPTYFGSNSKVGFPTGPYNLHLEINETDSITKEAATVYKIDIPLEAR